MIYQLSVTLKQLKSLLQVICGAKKVSHTHTDTYSRAVRERLSVTNENTKSTRYQPFLHAITTIGTTHSPYITRIT